VSSLSTSDSDNPEIFIRSGIELFPPDVNFTIVFFCALVGFMASSRESHSSRSTSATVLSGVSLVEPRCGRTMVMIFTINNSKNINVTVWV
jgi:hypothetical protein